MSKNLVLLGTFAVYASAEQAKRFQEDAKPEDGVRVSEPIIERDGSGGGRVVRFAQRIKIFFDDRGVVVDQKVNDYFGEAEIQFFEFIVEDGKDWLFFIKVYSFEDGTGHGFARRFRDGVWVGHYRVGVISNSKWQGPSRCVVLEEGDPEISKIEEALISPNGPEFMPTLFVPLDTRWGRKRYLDEALSVSAAAERIMIEHDSGKRCLPEGVYDSFFARYADLGDKLSGGAGIEDTDSPETIVIDKDAADALWQLELSFEEWGLSFPR